MWCVGVCVCYLCIFRFRETLHVTKSLVVTHRSVLQFTAVSRLRRCTPGPHVSRSFPVCSFSYNIFLSFEVVAQVPVLFVCPGPWVSVAFAAHQTGKQGPFVLRPCKRDHRRTWDFGLGALQQFQLRNGGRSVSNYSIRLGSSASPHFLGATS